MSGNEFPSNSKNPQPAEDPKKVERIVTNDVVFKKKSIGKRLREIFIGGDSNSVLQYIIMDVLVPQAKDMLADAATQGFERMIFGENRTSSRNRYGSRPSGQNNYTNYNRYATRGNNPIGRSGREDRPAHSQMRRTGIDDILMATRIEADEVLEAMYNLLEKYEMVSIADLHSMVGKSSAHTDHKWGWDDLTGSNVQRTRNGYVLNLPQPQSLD